MKTNEAKHTPGPWEIRMVTNWCGIARVGYHPHADVCSAKTKDEPWTETDEANARLIAAAPDLLAALVRLEEVGRIAYAGSYCGPQEWPEQDRGKMRQEYCRAAEQANAAIAKARGES